MKNRTRYRGRPTSLAIFTVCFATILSMNFSNLASTPFGRGRGSWPTSSTLTGTPHFSAFRDLGAPIKLPKFYDDDGLLWFKARCRTVSNNGSGSGLAPAQNILAVQVRVHLSTIFEVQVWFRFTQVKYYWFGFIDLKFNCSYSFRPEKKGEIADPVDDHHCSYCACTSASGIWIWKKYILTFVKGSGSVWVHLSTILRVQVWFRFTEVKFCWFRFGSGSPK